MAHHRNAAEEAELGTEQSAGVREQVPYGDGAEQHQFRSPDNQPSKDNATTASTTQTGEQPPNEKPSRIRQLWNAIGLDVMTATLMLKGSLPPTIAIAMYQSNAVAMHFSTLGYLVAITSILGFCIMPRGKFIQNMAMEIIAACFGSAVNLLALYCAVKAREHTTPAGQPLGGYNSSASAVLAIWLIVQLYFTNVVRAARPQFQFPAIIYSIFVCVSMTYGTQFTTMAACISFMESLIEAFLTGFALATGVHFFVFPTSSRMVVFKELTGYLMCLDGMLKAQAAYMASLEDFDPIAARQNAEREAQANGKKSKRKTTGARPGPLTTPAALQLNAALDKTIELYTKLHADITPAKREFAWGKLESHDLTELWKYSRLIFTPVLGLSASLDLLQRRASEANWTYEGVTESEKELRHRQIHNLHFLMQEMHTPFTKMTGEIGKGIQHVLITLELVKAPKKPSQDEESKGEDPTPGSPDFVESYKKMISAFHKSKEKTLEDWCREHNIAIPPNFFDENFIGNWDGNFRDEDKRSGSQKQLFFALYLDYLLYRTGSAVLDLIVRVEQRKSEGALKRSKLIFPGSRTLYKWLKAVVAREDLTQDVHFMTDMDSGGSTSVYLGADFTYRKDPEHLPPRNTAEKIGESIRKMSSFLRSDASSFGLRVVLATMSIGIVCYLADTQAFFLKQRLLWAMIMIAISMTRTAGQSLFNFALRIIGTVVAMAGSYIVWYIVDGKAPGVIVFLWIWIMLSFYFVVKTPKFIVVAILSMVTAVLIIGYELQVGVIGVAVIESNGQPAYPTYVLAPYRLATVTGGILVAFTWTMLPYPISENSEIRKDLGASLYLLSNFYSIVHETVRSRVNGTDGDGSVKDTHAFNLEKARNAVFNKLMLLLSTLKTNSAFGKFQLRVGGRFPRQEYEGLIECCGRLVRYTALIGYASTTFSLHDKHHGKDASSWSNDFRKLLTSVNSTSHQVTSLLSLLSSSLTNGQPLPPYLELPKPFQLVANIDSIDPDFLCVRHIAEPEYSAFAVLQICAHAINGEIETLSRHVKNLVGEIDFSFHAVKSSQASTNSSLSSVGEGEDKEKGA